ncbi:hypothetical protein [Sphingobacterium sp. MYb382]|uniref:hypothetical protein n=1 Tax=Sphingobacterium sp. MYb382 TaxID=2745278 RepID=UPI00309B5152
MKKKQAIAFTQGSTKSTIKSILTVCFVAVAAMSASAQKSVIEDAFSKYQIDTKLLDAEYLQQPTNYAYDMKQTLSAAGKETVTVATFDPTRPKDEQWNVLSINGKAASKSDVNSFRKTREKPAETNRADDATYKIDKETADYLVISFKLDPSSLPKEASFMKDCRMVMTINLKTKRLEKTQAFNEKPVRIKILTADKFELTVKHVWNDQAQRYFTTGDDLNMLAKFIGQETNVRTTSEYSNFAKK